jgi:hypothetical protein
MELVCTKQDNVSVKLVSNNFRIHLSTSRSGYCKPQVMRQSEPLRTPTHLQHSNGFLWRLTLPVTSLRVDTKVCLSAVRRHTRQTCWSVCVCICACVTFQRTKQSRTAVNFCLEHCMNEDCCFLYGY